MGGAFLLIESGIDFQFLFKSNNHIFLVHNLADQMLENEINLIPRLYDEI